MPWRGPTTLPPLRVWVWTAATLALAVVAAVLWRGSDAAATDSTTAAPADVPDGTPAGALSEVWSATGDPAPRVEEGRVVVGSPTGVRALDVGTGKEAWHYTRSDAPLCGATAVDGVVVTVFRTDDRCDQAVALDAGTGRRVWTRNLNLRADVTLSSTRAIVLAAGPRGLVTLDPTGNSIRWRYRPPGGCELTGAQAGSAGVVVLQRCADQPSVQARLFDGFDGEAHWTREVTAPERADLVLSGADAVVGLVAGDEFRALAPADGAELATVPLPAAEPAGPPPLQTAAGPHVLVWARGVLLGLDAATGEERWRQPALGLPSGGDTAEPAELLVPEEGAFVRREPGTGRELGRSSAPELRPGGTASVVGDVVVHRLTGEVVGYR